MEYRFLEYYVDFNYCSIFDINFNNEIYVFNNEYINVFDIEKKENKKRILSDNDDFRNTACVSSDGNLILSWDLYNNLKLYNISNKNNIVINKYSPIRNDVYFDNSVNNLKIEFTNDYKYFIYNCASYIEIVETLSLKAVLRIEGDNYPTSSDNIPVFFYDKKNNSLITSFFYSPYDTSGHFLSDRSLIKVINLNSLKVEFENNFSRDYNQLIYNSLKNKLVSLVKTPFYDSKYKIISVLELNKEKTSFLQKNTIDIDNPNMDQKFITINPITSDIFLVYIHNGKELNVFKINLDNYELECVFKRNTNLSSLSKVSFSLDGQYFIISNHKNIEIFEVIYK